VEGHQVHLGNVKRNRGIQFPIYSGYSQSLEELNLGELGWQLKFHWELKLNLERKDRKRAHFDLLRTEEVGDVRKSFLFMREDTTTQLDNRIQIKFQFQTEQENGDSTWESEMQFYLFDRMGIHSVPFRCPFLFIPGI